LEELRRQLADADRRAADEQQRAAAAGNDAASISNRLLRELEQSRVLAEALAASCAARADMLRKMKEQEAKIKEQEAKISALSQTTNEQEAAILRLGQQNVALMCTAAAADEQLRALASAVNVACGIAGVPSSSGTQ
jgi:chromosome segregation ATPase